MKKWENQPDLWNMKERMIWRIAPLERIQNFNEFHIPLSLEKQQVQGARCMACGVPFCQAGMMIGGMASGCPLQQSGVRSGTILSITETGRKRTDRLTEDTLFSGVYIDVSARRSVRSGMYVQS